MVGRYTFIVTNAPAYSYYRYEIGDRGCKERPATLNEPVEKNIGENGIECAENTYVEAWPVRRPDGVASGENLSASVRSSPGRQIMLIP